MRFAVFSVMLLSSAAMAMAQGANTLGPWGADMAEEWGLATVYSVDMESKMMGMTNKMHMATDGVSDRMEMLVPFMNIEMVTITSKKGDDVKVTILFPAAKCYSVEDITMDEDDMPKPEVKEEGTEMVDGVECIKRSVQMMEGGIIASADMYFSPEQRNMPVKMITRMPGMPESETIFKNYDFSTPDPALFEVPADYTLTDDPMKLLMGGMGIQADVVVDDEE